MTIINNQLYDINNDDITPQGHLEIPEGVTEISGHMIGRNLSYSFTESNCRRLRLTSITFPDSCTRINEFAFSDCLSLETVRFGKGLEVIGKYAFSDCKWLKEVIFNDSTPWFRKIGHAAFANCFRLTSIRLPDSVKTIDEYAFYGCASLTKIHMPVSLQYIGHGAFQNCDALWSEKKNYKAFGLDEDGRLVCRGLHYTVGKRTAVKGEIELCRRGLHYCTNLFEIFDFYNGIYGENFVIGECKVSKEYDEEIGTSKRCARAITPVHIYTREEFIDILNKTNEA